ncbi:MAG: response regulator transcription factor [Anaerolineales bacterium]|jgi:DNA-binding response OmpR family regulator
MESEAKILWIEGKRSVSPYFIPSLRKKGFKIETVSTGGEALETMSRKKHNLVVLNAASMRTSGTRICQSIHNVAPKFPILLITDREPVEVKASGADVILRLPFTTRKLVNRIKPYMPGDDKNCLKAGPIRLDTEKKRVYCESREANLTPRMVHILRTLMENPNQLIEREELFSQIWETQYTEDTRTLDVHISWLRKAIEDNPRDPKYLITVRSKGYLLDV